MQTISYIENKERKDRISPTEFELTAPFSNSLEENTKYIASSESKKYFLILPH